MIDEDPGAAPVFKKRAKTTFKRKHESSDDESATSPQLSVTDILRQRRHGKPRRPFMNSSTTQDDQPMTAVSTSERQETDLDKMKNRFVPQTGQVVSTYDKQMNDYIEAKMAEYRNQNGSARPTTTSNDAPAHMAETTPSLASAKPHTTDKQSVTAGKLMEVDLAASLHDEDATKATKAPKIRLGRDGKPWRPRRRRNSEDQARDALVDSILKDTPLSRFQDPATSTSGPSSNAKQDYVDEDTVLENFKSNYQDPEYRTVRKPTTTGKKQDEKKGPRLGGSKNARRAMEEQAATQKKT